MIWYVFALQLISLPLEMHGKFTTLYFESEIVEYQGARQGKVRIHEPTSDRKSLMIELLDKKINDNFYVYTKDNVYTFKFRYKKGCSYPFLKIKNAKESSSGMVLKENKNWMVLDTGKSYRVINKNKNSLNVNGKNVLFSESFSKGPFLEVNGKRVDDGC